jgi:hypothetical protein
MAAARRSAFDNEICVCVSVCIHCRSFFASCLQPHDGDDDDDDDKIVSYMLLLDLIKS